MVNSIRKYISVAVLLMLAASFNAQAVTIIYSSGHGIDETAAALGNVELAAGNPSGGFSAGDLADAIGDGQSGIYGAYDALVLGENYDSFDADDQALIAEFTSNGGHTVVLGGHGSEVDFLNETFGYAVTHFPASSTDHTPIYRVAGDGPEQLLTLDGSWFVEAAPETVLYEREGGGDAAFISGFGAGTVSWLAWDFCECGEDDEDQADWFSLLSSAAITPLDLVPVPTLSNWMLILLVLALGFVGMTRISRKTA